MNLNYVFEVISNLSIGLQIKGKAETAEFKVWSTQAKNTVEQLLITRDPNVGSTEFVH